MNKHQEPLEALREIRNMMERSSRFSSLSGLAGVVIGLFAIAGVAGVYLYLGLSLTSPGYHLYAITPEGVPDRKFLQFFFSDALIVLAAALLTGSWMAVRKARKQQLPVWDATARRLLINMLIPLATGGVYALILLYHGHIAQIAPATLIFYGLALVNASKYTIDEIRTLGILEIIAGLLAAVFSDYGLLLWAAGFGVLHIIYGITIYSKYEK